MRRVRARAVRTHVRGALRNRTRRHAHAGSHDRRLVAATLLATLLLLLGVGSAMRSAETTSEQQLLGSFARGGQVGAEFISTYVARLLAQETAIAGRLLAGEVNAGRLGLVRDAHGFDSVIVLDQDRRVLGTVPATMALGEVLQGDYQHIASAEAGRPAVSDVVWSPIRDAPLVGFATDFSTPSGRRVFSGGYRVSDTQLRQLVEQAASSESGTAYLLDTQSQVVAASSLTGTGVMRLADVEPALAAARGGSDQGAYLDANGTVHVYAEHPVVGTPWSVVVAAPRASVLAPSRTSTRTVARLALVLLGVLAAAANWLAVRMVRQQSGLRVLNVKLDRLARLDELTGLSNRRQLSEALDVALSAGRRRDSPVSVLLVDIDHFKSVNDVHGHAVGDLGIQHVAAQLRRVLRQEDTPGRWGGEEFLVVLPSSDSAAAQLVAERLLQAVRDRPFAAGPDGPPVRLTVSVGHATGLHEDAGTLVQRADDCLYEAKAAGRDTVRPQSVEGPGRPAVGLSSVTPDAGA